MSTNYDLVVQATSLKKLIFRNIFRRGNNNQIYTSMHLHHLKQLLNSYEWLNMAYYFEDERNKKYSFDELMEEFDKSLSTLFEKKIIQFYDSTTFLIENMGFDDYLS